MRIWLLFGVTWLAWGDPADRALSVLETRCVACHGGSFKKSGLDLSTRESLVRGGDRGPAVVSGDAKASLLYKAVAHSDDPHMPFKADKLPDADIAALAEWINQGAPFPRTLKVAAAKASAPPKESHWAFQKPNRPPVPKVKNSAWVRNPVDAFLSRGHEQHNLAPLAAADREVLLRRVYLDLVGVPPTREELHQFQADRSPSAYEKLVDRLLADPRYGERWGRHWMDIWRYSDWYGWRKANDVRFSHRFIWRWRDWIVDSLNDDKAYDRMIVEMLAGDEVAPNDPQVVRATGFLVRNFQKYDRQGWMQDTVDHTMMGLMGVTVKCARCHDHKYDPFSQEEYFRMRAIFEPYQVRIDRVPGQPDMDKDGLSRVVDADLNAQTFRHIRGDVQNPDKDHPLAPGVPASLGGQPLKVQPVPLPLESYYPDYRAFVHADLIAQAKGDIERAEAALLKAQSDAERMLAGKTLAAARAFLPALEARIAADKAKYARPPDPNLESLTEAARKAERQAGILKADGDLLRAQQELSAALASRKPDGSVDDKKVAEAQKRLTDAGKALTQAPEGYTAIGTLYPETSSGRRLALARWISSRENPLTARVAVNHIWLRHFGKALVPTVFDFGKNGKPPSNPELLDWLASEFMESGWSMKRVHRLILTSNAYRMRSSAGPSTHPNVAIDPDNVYLWRMNPRRMEAESVRDSMLAVAGTLDLTRGGPEISYDKALESKRRSIYIQHTPDLPSEFLKIFDSANTAECYTRTESVVPHQALALANSTLSREQARLIAKNLWKDSGGSASAFVTAVFETMLGRPPSTGERTKTERFLIEQPELFRQPSQLSVFRKVSTETPAPAIDATARAREDMVHVLLNHNDFVTIR